MRLAIAMVLGLSGVCAFTASAEAGSIMYGGAGRGSSVNPGGLLLLDQTDGSGSLLGTPSPGAGLTGIDFSPSGALYATAISGQRLARTTNLIVVDPNTGALVLDVGLIRAVTGAPITIGDLAFQPGTGTLFGIQSSSGGLTPATLFTIDLTTAVATQVGVTSQLFGGGIAFAPDGTLYLNQFVDLFTLDPTTGAILTTTPILGPGFGVGDGLGIRPEDGVLFGTSAGPTGDSIWIIDPVTGQTTLLGATGAGALSDIAFHVRVPEPGTWALFGLGVLGLTGAVRRRRRAAVASE